VAFCTQSGPYGSRLAMAEDQRARPNGHPAGAAGGRARHARRPRMKRRGQATRFRSGRSSMPGSRDRSCAGVGLPRRAAAVLGHPRPRDLTGLGCHRRGRRTFSVGQQTITSDRLAACRMGRGPPRRWPGDRLALPLQGAVNVSFNVEVLRRINGNLPPGLTALGLDRLAEPQEKRAHFRAPWLWLEPIQVRLLPPRRRLQLSSEPRPGDR